MQKIVIDNYVLNVTNAEADKLQQLSTDVNVATEIEQPEAWHEFAKFCDALLNKYANKLYISHIYHTII